MLKLDLGASNLLGGGITSNGFWDNDLSRIDSANLIENGDFAALSVGPHGSDLPISWVILEEHVHAELVPKMGYA